jgi:hypothetical protein
MTARTHADEPQKPGGGSVEDKRPECRERPAPGNTVAADVVGFLADVLNDR